MAPMRSLRIHFFISVSNVSVDRFGFCASAQKQIRSNAWFSAPQISIGTARRSRSLRHLRVSLPPIPPSHLLHDSDFVGSNSHVEPQNRPCNAARPHGDLVAVQALCACRRPRRCGRGDFIPSALAVNPFFSPSSRAPYLGAGNSVLGQSQPLKDKVKKTKSFRESTRTLPGCDKEAWGAEGLVPAMPSPSPCHMPRIIITLYFTFQTGWRPFLLLIQSDDASIPWQALFLISSGDEMGLDFIFRLYDLGVMLKS